MMFLFPLSGLYSQSATISPETLYLGRIPEGTEAARKIVIYGTSVTPYQVSDIRFEGADADAFSLMDVSLPFSVGIAELRVLEILFEPAAEGVIDAQMVIESNAGSSPDIIPLTGEGTDLDDGFVVFERIFGGIYSDGAGSVRITADGGYILAGGTRRLEDEEEFGDATLIKTDQYGQIEWSRWYGEDDMSEGFSEAILTSDGGYIAVGNIRETQGNSVLEPDVWVVKFNAAGDEQWQKTFGRSEFWKDEGSDIIELPGGGYLIAGASQTVVGQLPHDDAYIIRIDAQGNEVWSKVFGGLGGEEAQRLKPMPDGNFVFIGSTSSFSTGGLDDWDFYLVKIDIDGNEIWTKTYGGSSWDRSGSVIIAGDGGFVMSGYTASPEFGAEEPDAFLVKTDADGEIEWTQVYGFDDFRDGGGEVIATEDGGYFILGGASLDYDPGLEEYRSDIYVIKTDAAGNKVWDRLIGGYHNEGASCVRQTADGGYIISASSETYNTMIGYRDIYLLKLDRNGLFTDVRMEADALPVDYSLSQNYPNPFNSSTIISYSLFKGSRVRLTLYNVLGQPVRTLVDAFQQAGIYTIHLDAGDLESGMYIYRIETEEFSESKHMLLIR
jgi:hypothetical protein